MAVPQIPQSVAWRDGLVLEPEHFLRTDRRAATLAHLAALVADPWPWGFTRLRIDQTALASGQIRADCEGIFPDGIPFRANALIHTLDLAADATEMRVALVRHRDTGELSVAPGDHAPSALTLPLARLVLHAGTWSPTPEWSAPVLLVGPDHPLRDDLNRQLGALAALAAGFAATLRIPGAQDRPAARTISAAATELNAGVAVIEALLAAPAVTPGRIGTEALRLALTVRGITGEFERPGHVWDPADQRGSLRRLLGAAEAAASGIGLPFRASVFHPDEARSTFIVDSVPTGDALLAIEASKPADLITARTWLEGAALAAPERIQEALTRRVSGCRRQSVERDPQLGIASSALLGLYRIAFDPAWRGQGTRLALASRTEAPAHTTFSILIPEHAEPSSDTLPERTTRPW